MDLFEKYGYSEYREKCKKPGSIIIVNLWSPKIEYTDYGKSQINLKPFSKTIAETLYKMCSGSGSKGLTNDNGGGSDQQRAVEIFTDFLKKDIFRCCSVNGFLFSRQGVQAARSSPNGFNV